MGSAFARLLAAAADAAGFNRGTHGAMQSAGVMPDAPNGLPSAQIVRLRQRSDVAHPGQAIGQSPREVASISADMRSESAFVSGAAQALEASIADASTAITELADAFADAATSASHASDLSARAEELALLANTTITRLNNAARQITEIVVFIGKVALQRQQASSDIQAFVTDVIGGADAARLSIDAVCAVIISMRDAMHAIAAQTASNTLSAESSRTSLPGAKPVGDHLTQAMGGIQDRFDTIAEFTGRVAHSAATIREQASTLAVQAEQSLADARHLSAVARGRGMLPGEFKR